ncbi:MAG: Rv2175c family DNA-binding protein [Bowdeniella nasicola]|nr:Rv2175c family DNA-binding protein [Bowdeniella nasicola]
MSDQYRDATGRLMTRAEVAGALGVDERRIRNLIRSHDLFVIQTEDGPRIPEFALECEGGGYALNPALRGTITHLMDLGLTEAEAIEWLTAPNVELGTSPLALLHAGHIHTVRRVAISTTLEG